jgi:hypothetical protein
MKLRNIIIAALILLFAIACSSNNEEQQEQAAIPAGNHKVEVLEVLQANAYTYLRVDENGKEVWMAVTKMNAEEGDILYYKDSFEMKDFQSKDLERTFESILFVQAVSPTPFGSPQMPKDVKSAHSNVKPQTKTDIKVEKAEGGITIGELFAGKESYSGKTVKVRGEVTKVNLGIMGRNWIHIQDGTADGNNYDLTITTDREASVGDVVTFEGTVTVNKDFGSGYSYEVIIEEAKVIANSKS